MRTLALSVIIAIVYATSGCGSDEPSEAVEPTISSAPTSQAPAPTSAAPEPVDNGAESTQQDVEAFAVQLEQDFFATGYPDDLVGARKAAKKTGLDLAPGNSIGSYVYDASDAEFRLCVENVSGAFAIYDTSPMSLREAGDEGGCPAT